MDMFIISKPNSGFLLCRKVEVAKKIPTVDLTYFFLFVSEFISHHLNPYLSTV